MMPDKPLPGDADSAAPPQTRPKRPPRVPKALLGGLLLLNTLLLFVYLCVWITIRLDLTYPEGAVVTGAWRVASGRPLYTDWREWPHQFTPYGPVLYWTVGGIARLAGQGRPDFSFYLLGRLQSVLALLGICALTCMLAIRVGCGRSGAIVCGAGLFGLWTGLMEYTVTYRPDAPMVFWNMLAVWVALGGLGPTWRRWAVLGCLWLAAGYKPQGWAASMVVGYLAWRSLSPRDAIVWSLVYVAGGACSVFALNWATAGIFLLNTYTAMFVGLQVPQLFGQTISEVLVGLWDMLVRIALLIGLGGWLWKSTGESTESKALGAYFCVSTALSALQLFKVGSDVNYLLEPFALSGTAAAIFYQRWLRPGSPLPPSTKRLAWFTGLLCVGWWLLTSLHRHTGSLTQFNQREVSRMARIELALHSTRKTFSQERLARTLPPVLLMDSSFIHPDPLAHAIDDPVYYCVMLDRGKLSPQSFLLELERKRFQLIALSPVAEEWFFTNVKDKRIREMLTRHYISKPGKGYPKLWTPKPADH